MGDASAQDERYRLTAKERERQRQEDIRALGAQMEAGKAGSARPEGGLEALGQIMMFRDMISEQDRLRMEIEDSQQRATLRIGLAEISENPIPY
jgi:hypothetical protein